MKTYIVDFEEVLKNFEPYHQSLKEIQEGHVSLIDYLAKVQ